MRSLRRTALLLTVLEADLSLPSDFLSKAEKQVKRSPTRRRLSKGAAAAAPPPLPPVWGYLTPEQKKEWRRKAGRG